MHFCRRPQLGITITELVVGLALVAVILSLSVPALAGLVQASELSAATGELLADLQLARAEALKRNRRVALCKSADAVRCTEQGGWEQGWIVFDDENRDGERGDDEEVLARRAALPPAMRMLGNQPVAGYISYTALGASKLTGGGFQAGTLTICRRSGQPTAARQVILNSVGRPRVQKATVARCG
jgi:type IV fimbrial biogenesis protein FimT